MAVVWRSWNNRARAGIEAIVSGSGSSRTITVHYWAQMDQYASTNGSSTVTLSGAITGNLNQNLVIAPGGQKQLGTRTMTVNLTDSAQSFVFGMSFTHYGGGGGLVTTGYSPALSVSVPARVPLTPTGLAITRLSDGSHRLNWSRKSTYTSVVVQRRTDGGSWVQVAKPSGNVATYTDSTTQANRKYEYRVAGVSAGGQSGYSNVATVYTTPAAVGSVTATKVGLDIRVTAGSLPPYATAYELYDNSVLVDGNVTSWPVTVAAPDPSVTHTYTVYAKRGSLRSAGRDSNTVQLLAPPLAPTGLSPNGAVKPSDEPVVVSWTHNPVDTTAQTEAEVAYWYAEDGWKFYGTVGAENSFTVPFDVAEAYEWQVRTKGEHAEFGPWSAVATYSVVDRPGVVVQGDGVLESPELSAVWSYVQGQGRPQSAWRAELLDSGGALVERKEGSGAANTTTFAHRGGHGETYTIRVQAATGNIWSAWAPLTVTLNFLPPAPALFDGVWDETSGTVGITVGEGRGPDLDDVVNLFTNPRLVGDGTWAEVRRNKFINPHAESLEGFAGSYGAGGEGSLSSATAAGRGIADLGLVDPSEVRCVATTPPTSGFSRLSVTRIAVTPGVPISVGAYVRGSNSARYRIAIDWADSSGAYMSFVVGEWIQQTFPGTGTGTDFALHKMEGLIPPAGAAYLQLFAMKETVTANQWVSVAALWSSDSPTLGPYLDGSTTPETAVGVVQPEDFRWRWLGTPNESESVMEIERVRGLTSFDCVAGVSQRDGKPAARLIPTGSGGYYSCAFFEIPSSARSSGTLIGTVHQDAPVQPPLDSVNERVANVAVSLPEQRSPGYINEAGSRERRLTYSEITSQNLAILGHGGVAGSGDLWWSDIGLFAGDYDGPVFSGADGLITVGESVMSTSWDGAEDNSPSRARMVPHTVTIDVERSVEEGVWELVRENVEPGEVFEDRESLSNGVTQYRVTSYADTGAATVKVYDVESDSPAVWLSGGDFFEDTARLPYNPKRQIEAGREKVAHRFSGRQYAVIDAGEALSRVVAFGGSTLDGDSEVATDLDLERIAQSPAPIHQYRDPTGRRLVGELSPVVIDRISDGHYAFSASLEQSER